MSNKLLRFFILAMIVIALFLRLIVLGEVPPGLANDEANIILNAQSLLHTGSNIPGVVTGIIGQPTGSFGAGIHSEISSYILALFYAVIGFSWPLIKLPFILASLGVVIFSYLITKNLLNKPIALIVLALAVINPWSIQFARSGYESILSACFYLAAIYLVLRVKNWKILYVLPLLMAGFLSYFSAKTLLLPLALIILMAVKLFRPKESLKPTIVLNIFIILFIIGYGILLKNSPAGVRIRELNNTSTADTVNWNRTHSLNFPLQTIVENKYVEDLRFRLNASLGNFAPTFLFLNGKPESSGHLYIPDQAPLYLVEILFVIFGLIFSARKYPKAAIFLSGLAAITLIPNFLNLQGTTYMLRTVILFPVLVIFAGTGIYGLYESLPGKKLKIAATIFVFLAYLFLTAVFINQYYYRLPISNNNSFFFHDRVATRYIQSELKSHPNKKIVWITPDFHFTFYRYLFFSRLYDNGNIKQINDSLEKGTYEFNNVLITDSCPEKFDTNSTLYLVDPSAKCSIPQTTALITNIDDAGAKYRLVSDPLCQQFTHNRYPLIKQHRLLDVESLSNKDFCENYISNNQENLQN